MMKRILLLVTFVATLPAVLQPSLIETELSYNPRNAKGVYPFVSYLGGQGSINLVNGNLTFTKPLVSRQGRAGFGINLSLVHNSKIWDRSGGYMVVKEPGSWVGLGWRLEFPKLIQGTSSYAIVSPDGSSHEIADHGGGVWKSVDSSYIFLDPATRIAVLPDGAKLIFGNSIGNTSYLTEMKDRNGNQIKAYYVAGTGKLSKVKDTLGTAALFYYDADGYLAQVLSLGETKTHVDFTYNWRSLNPSFSIPTQAAYEKVLKSATIWSNFKDLKQTYYYDTYGALSDVVNEIIEYECDCDQPDCRGKVLGSRADTLSSYQYQTGRFWDSLYGSVEERVVTRKIEYLVNSGGTSYSTWYIGYEVDQTESNPSRTTVNDDKGRSEYYFNYTINGRTWSDGLAQSVQRRTSASANPPLQLLRTGETSWTQDLPSAAYIVNPRVTSQTTTLETGQSSRKEYVYTSDGSGNVQEVKEYGFDLLLKRKTVTQYWHETYPAYTALNLTRLPASVSVQDGSGTEASRTEYIYDGGTLTGYGGSIQNHDPAYDAAYTTRGNATSVRQYYQEAGRYVASTMSYDTLGNMVSRTDPRGNATSISYSAALYYAVAQSATNVLGHVTQNGWSRQIIYAPDGSWAGYGPAELTSVVDANNVTVASYWYDYLSRKTQEQTPTETKNYSYDDRNYLATASSASGYGYTTGNPTGEAIKQEQSDPAGANIVQTASYNLWYQPAAQSVPYRSGGWAPSTTYSYDALGRLTSISPPDTGATSYTYTGNATLAVDPAGRRKLYTYDALGRIEKASEEDAQGTLNVDTTYEYDVLDRLRRIVQGAQTRTFVYDSLGRLTSESHPESGTTTYGYDDNGNLTAKTDARGVVTTNSYDALNRLVASSYSDGTPGVTLSYDQTSSSLIGLITNGKGRQTSAWTSDGIGYSWSYDVAGRALDQVFKIDGVTYPVNYSYTDTGCGCTKADLMSMTYPGGFQVKYGRDSIGRVLSISKPNPVVDEDWYVRQVEYNSQSGAMSKIHFGNYWQDWFFYDWSGRLQIMRLKNATQGSPFIWWNYSYDTSGRLTGIEETKRPNEQTILQATFTYSYDRWGRLASGVRQYDDGYGHWSTDWTLSYGYDRYGNMLSRQGGNWTQTFTVDEGTNRLSSDTKVGGGSPSTVSYDYDAAGHTVTRGTRSNSWDAAGRLKEVRQPSDGALYGSYRYDALGRRVKKSWSYYDYGQRTGAIVYVYGAGGELLAEYRNDTEGPYGPENSTTYNIHMGTTVVAKRVTGTAWGSPYSRTEWLHRNHLQEVVGADYSNMNGCTYCMQWTWTYSQPFGSGGSDQFEGHKDDGETGLKYFGARYYSSNSVRWASADSVTAHLYDPQSLNKYAYVRNDPVNYVDRDGRFGEVIFIYIDIYTRIETDYDVHTKAGGGRGGTSGGGVGLVQFNNKVDKAKQTLISKLGEPLSKNCQQFFKDIVIDPDAFLQMLKGEVKVLDGETNQAVIDTIIGADAAQKEGVSGWTVAELFKKGFPHRYGPPPEGWSPFGSPNIYLVPSAITPENIAHEVFHKFEGHDDPVLMAFLSSSDSTEGTAIISRKFKEACLQ